MYSKCMLQIPSEAPISLRLTLWLAISTSFGIFHFPTGHNVKFIFLCVQNPKKKLLARTVTGNIYTNFGWKES